ncbi:MAG: FecR family protein [Polyangiaceae bacterium]|nr:FecR family protein [Polyangiaceae bacterium]
MAQNEPRLNEEELAFRLGELAKMESSSPHPAEWQKLERRLRAAPQRRRVWLGGAALGLGFAVAAAVAFVSWPEAAVTYRQTGGVTSERGFVSAKDRPTTFTFSEESQFTLLPGSTARVSQTSPHGARITLEVGELEANVNHLPHAAWSVDAGPYVVQVTGTRFSVAWSALSGELEVTVTEGSVNVTGPELQPGIAVTKGRFLRALSGGSVQLGETRERLAGKPRDVARQAASENGATDAPAVSTPALENGLTEGKAESPSPTGKAQPRASFDFRARMAKGEYRELIEDAQRLGTEEVLGKTSSEGVAALADAARYVGAAALAEQALLTQRRRFSGSAEAAQATFLLGRLAEDAGKPSVAIRWYETYAEEAPRGRYLSSALGRRLILINSSDPLRAKKLATDYLVRFPKGMFAGEAARIVRGL